MEEKEARDAEDIVEDMDDSIVRAKVESRSAEVASGT